MRRLGFRERTVDGLGRARGGEDRSELFGKEEAACAFERGEKRSDVFHAGERQPAVPDAEVPGLGGLFKEAGDRALVCFGERAEEEVAAGRRAGEGGSEAEDGIELERLAVDALLPVRFQYYGVARRSSESLRSIFLRAWIALRLRFALGFS